MSVFDVQATRQHYLERLLDRCNLLILPTNGSSAPLQTIFQSLRLQRDSPVSRQAISEASGHSSRKEDASVRQHTPILTATGGADALRQSPQQRLVILGGPGMGKTTLLKDLLRQAIQHAQRDLAAPLPLFLSLPDLAHSGLPFQEYLPQVLKELQVDLRYAPVLAESLTAGRAFLCLDSLDEVMPALRPEIILRINREALTWGGTWIIGSRFSEYKGGQFAPGLFVEWELQPLDAAGQLELARKLFSFFSPARNIDSDTDKSQISAYEAKRQEGLTTNSSDAHLLLKLLHEDAQLASWGENPLLLSLATLIYAHDGVLPIHRATLYRKGIETLLGLRLTQKGKQEELLVELADLALSCYQSSGRTFTFQDISSWLEQRDSQENKEQHTTHLVQLLNSGMLDVVAYQTSTFKHQMFQEYLAALALAQQLCSSNEQQSQSAWDFLWSKRTYSRWEEILRLLVSILLQTAQGKQIATRWLESLASLRDQPEGDIGLLGLGLALRSVCDLSFSGEEAPLAELASMLVLAWAEATISSPGKHLQCFARHIRSLNEHITRAGVARLITVLLDPNENVWTRSCIAEILGELGGYEPINALFVCLRGPYDGNLFGAIQQVLKSGRIQVPLDFLLSILRDTHQSYFVSEAAAHLLGQQEGPEALEALLLLTENRDSHVACAAIEALALWSEQASVERLIVLLQDGESLQCRSAALALGKIGKAASQSVPALIQALRSPARYVQGAATQALIELGSIPYQLLLAWPEEGIDRQEMPLTESEVAIEIEPLLAILRDPEKLPLYEHVLRLTNKQGFRLPAHILLNLIDTVEWSLSYESELKQAFCLLGSEAPVDALLDRLNTSSGRFLPELTFEILGELHQYVPVEAMLRQYERHQEHTDVDWALALIKFGERILASDLITIAYTCSGRRDGEYGDEIAEALGALGPYIVDALLERLYDYGFLDYGILTKALRMVYDHVPIEKLFAALEKSEGDRCIAARIVGVAGDDRSLQILLNALKEPKISAVVYYNILIALGNFQRGISPEVILTALQYEDGWVPHAAVHLLQQIHTSLDMSAFVEPLQALILAHPEHEQNVSWALEALGLCGSAAPIEFLIARLNASDLFARDSFELDFSALDALDALEKLVHYIPLETLYTLLEHASSPVRDLAIEGMRQRKEEIALERLLLLTSKNEDVAWSVASLLGELGISVAALETFLEYPDEQVVEGARKALSLLSENRWQMLFGDMTLLTSSELAEVLRGGNKRARSRIIELGEQAPIEMLMTALGEISSGDTIRQDLISTLEEIAEKAPKKILELAPSHNLAGVRMAQLRAWSTMGKDSPLDVIVTLLSDKDHQVVDLAIDLLGELGNPAAIEPLMQLLLSREHGFRCVAIVDALKKLGASVPLEILLEDCGASDYESRYLSDMDFALGIKAAKALKQADPEAFNALIPQVEALFVGEAPTGVFASRSKYRLANTIGEIGRADPPLLKLLSELLDWPYWQVRMKAAEALGKLRRNIPDATIRRLMELRYDAQSQMVRTSADNALAEILSLENSIEDE